MNKRIKRAIQMLRHRYSRKKEPIPYDIDVEDDPIVVLFSYYVNTTPLGYVRISRERAREIRKELKKEELDELEMLLDFYGITTTEYNEMS